MLRTSVFVILLAQSMLLQAESAGVGNMVSRTGDPSPDGNLQNRYQQQGYSSWPDSRASAKEMVPPPPPGPYRSSALSDYSVQGSRSVSRNLNKPVTSVKPSNIPMETFSPDRPWPDYQGGYGNNRYARQWVPDAGVRYRKPPVETRAYPPTINTMPENGNHLRPYLPPDYATGYNKPVNRAPYPVTGNHGNQ